MWILEAICDCRKVNNFHYWERLAKRFIGTKDLNLASRATKSQTGNIRSGAGGCIEKAAEGRDEDSPRLPSDGEICLADAGNQ